MDVRSVAKLHVDFRRRWSIFILSLYDGISILNLFLSAQNAAGSVELNADILSSPLLFFEVSGRFLGHYYDFTEIHQFISILYDLLITSHQEKHTIWGVRSEVVKKAPPRICASDFMWTNNLYCDFFELNSTYAN